MSGATPRLRGLTWGHRRAIAPLIAASEAYEARTGQPGAAATVEARTSELVAAFAQATRPVIAVSNEVGQGLVPADAGARLFRDELGRLNARVAAVVDEVWFCTAGLPQRLK